MTNSQLTDEAISFTPILKGSDALLTRRLKRRFSPYNFGLFSFDLLVLVLSFMIVSVIQDGLLYWKFVDFINVIIVCLIILSFFPTYHLYNYHRIFLPPTHLFLALRALGWSAFTLFLIIILYRHPDFIEGNFSLYILFLIGFFFVMLSRFFSDHLLNFVILLGITFFALGIMGFVGEGYVFLLEKDSPLPYSFALGVMLVLSGRFFLVHIVFSRWLKSQFRRQVVIVGSDEDAQSITEYIIQHNAPFWVTGFIGPEEESCVDKSLGKERLCELKDLPTVVQEKEIADVIVTDERIDKRVLISLLDYCTSEGLTAWFPPKIMPIIEMKLYIDDFGGTPMIRLCSQKNNWFFNKVKYGLDALATLPVLILLSPVLVFISVLIKANSKGPAFYRARAIGQNGQEFTMFKFRSMVVNSDSNIHKEFVQKMIKGELLKENKDDGVLKITDDPRITSVGRILRRTSLDELPQLINVLKGDMSLVGPRPCLPYEYELYKDWHKKRLSIRPGITCLWQVAGRSDVDFEDMILLDLYYIYNRGLIMDLNILYETFYAVIGKRGAY